MVWRTQRTFWIVGVVEHGLHQPAAEALAAVLRLDVDVGEVGEAGEVGDGAGAADQLAAAVEAERDAGRLPGAAGDRLRRPTRPVGLGEPGDDAVHVDARVVVVDLESPFVQRIGLRLVRGERVRHHRGERLRLGGQQEHLVGAEEAGEVPERTGDGVGQRLGRPLARFQEESCVR